MPVKENGAWRRRVGVRSRLSQQSEHSNRWFRKDSVKLIGVPLTIVCGYCRRPEHLQRNCRIASGYCFKCGSKDHLMIECPFKKLRNATPVRLALPAPPPGRNPEPVGRRAPLPPQQRGSRIGVDRGRVQAYYLSAGEAEASVVVADGQGAQYPDQEP